MDTKVINDVGTASIALLSGLLIVVAAIGVVEPQEVTSQNATTNSPFSIIGETGTQNQTQMVLANLTRADFAPVTSALDLARDSILANSSQNAYTSELRR
jgi:hypothetical protein